MIYLYKKNQEIYKNNQTFIFIYNIPEKREATHFLREILLKVLSDLKVIWIEKAFIYKKLCDEFISQNFQAI